MGEISLSSIVIIPFTYLRPTLSAGLAAHDLRNKHFFIYGEIKQDPSTLTYSIKSDSEEVHRNMAILGEAINNRCGTAYSCCITHLLFPTGDTFALLNSIVCFNKCGTELLRNYSARIPPIRPQIFTNELTIWLFV